MTDRPAPQGHTEILEQGAGFTKAQYTAPFIHNDGWTEITVGWHEEEMPDESGKYVGAWVARSSVDHGGFGHSRTSQLEAMAELVRATAALTSILLLREVELHRAIHNSPDALVQELRAAEHDLHRVQQYITTHVEPKEGEAWGEGLEPLWRAERALEAFAARLAAPPTEQADGN